MEMDLFLVVKQNRLLKIMMEMAFIHPIHNIFMSMEIIIMGSIYGIPLIYLMSVVIVLNCALRGNLPLIISKQL